MTRPRTQLYYADETALCLALGGSVWLFRGPAAPALHLGTETAVRAALLEQAGLAVWPEDWTLERVGHSREVEEQLHATVRDLSAALAERDQTRREVRDLRGQLATARFDLADTQRRAGRLIAGGMW